MANVKVKNNIDKLMRGLKDDYKLRVGILGSVAKSAHPSSKSLTNAELGTIHEFGLGNVPRRSFLEDPLKAGFNFNKDDTKPIKKALWENIFIKHNPKQAYNDMGFRALQIIEESWQAGGNPAWHPLTAQTLKRKEALGLSPNILTATGQLKNTISFKVIKVKKQ